MTNPLPLKRLFIVAGEASGDLHAAKLILAFKRLHPRVEFSGIGGPKMQEAGATLTYHASDLGVVGLSELWEKLGTIRSALRWAATTVIETKPDAVVLVDYPDFNLRLAEKIQGSGVPIIYYISPQVWAWRAKRVQKMKRIIRKMLVIFPFEEEFYRREGMDVTYVGHPILDEIDQETAAISRESVRQKFQIRPDEKLIAVMPGSRQSEIRHHLQTLLNAVQHLQDRIPHQKLRFLIPVAPTLNPQTLQIAIERQCAPVQLTQANASRVLMAADLALVASGTSTLQTALLGIPMVIIYRVAPLGWFIYSKFFRQIDVIGLPNIVAKERIVPEVVQESFTPEKIAEEAHRLLTDPQMYQKTKTALATRVRQKLEMTEEGSERSVRKTASMKAAEALYEVVFSAPSPLFMDPRI